MVEGRFTQEGGHWSVYGIEGIAEARTRQNRERPLSKKGKYKLIS